MKPDYADRNQMRALNANNIPKPTDKDGPILNNLAREMGQPPQAGAPVRRPMPGGTPQVSVNQRVGPQKPTPQLASPGPQPGAATQTASAARTPIMGPQRRPRPGETPGQQAQGGPQSIQAIIELLRSGAGGGGQPGRRALPGTDPRLG